MCIAVAVVPRLHALQAQPHQHDPAQTSGKHCVFLVGDSDRVDRSSRSAVQTLPVTGYAQAHHPRPGAHREQSPGHPPSRRIRRGPTDPAPTAVGTMSQCRTVRVLRSHARNRLHRRQWREHPSTSAYRPFYPHLPVRGRDPAQGQPWLGSTGQGR
ncbi:hypothetical protein D3C76_1392560 [compost metagenome]